MTLAGLLWELNWRFAFLILAMMIYDKEKS
jgi:hypothetical protein